MHRLAISSVANISDRAGMPRLGKIRLGEKKKSASGKEYPAEIDYFRCDPDEGMQPSDRTLLLERYGLIYGARPTVLTDVFLPSDDRTFTFPNALEAWKKTAAGAKRWCYGDGVRASRIDFQTGDWSDLSCCHVQECPVMNAGECKLVSRLRIFLPKISMAGYWQIDTSSQASTGNVIDGLNQLEGMFGRLTNIPLALSREPKDMTFEGKVTKHFILHLRAPNVDITEFQKLLATRQLALPPAPPNPTTEADDADIPEDVPEELVPEAIQEPAVDPELLAKINVGFDILGTSQAQRESSLHQFKGRELDLLKKISYRIDAAEQPL